MPVQTVGTQTAAALVEAATAAPSMHNAQPWRFRFQRASDTFQVRAATDRVLPHCDPYGRGLHVGCGAAVFNLRVAAAHAGWIPVTQLLPDPYDPRLMATVRLERPAGDTTPPAGLAALYGAVRERRSSRQPFTDAPVPEAVRDALREAAEAEAAQLYFPDPWHVRMALDLVQDAEGRDLRDRWRVEEMISWTRTGPEAVHATDGVPEDALGPRLPDGRASARDFAGREPVTGEREGAGYEREPQLALLGTVEDRPVDWVRSGQALERVLLVATVHGLSTGFTSHALEWAELRWPVRDPRSAMRRVQLVLRLGYGPQTPPTPRRPVHEVLDIDRQ